MNSEEIQALSIIVIVTLAPADDTISDLPAALSLRGHYATVTKHQAIRYHTQLKAIAFPLSKVIIFFDRICGDFSYKKDCIKLYLLHIIKNTGFAVLHVSLSWTHELFYEI